MYRGREGMWSWVLHRVTGVGVLLFLMIHILDTSLVMMGPETYNRVVAIYRYPFFKVLEVGLFAAVLYHSLNGVRILVMDFVPATTLHQRKMFWVGLTVFFLAMAPVSYLMLSPIFTAVKPH